MLTAQSFRIRSLENETPGALFSFAEPASPYQQECQHLCD